MFVFELFDRPFSWEQKTHNRYVFDADGETFAVEFEEDRVGNVILRTWREKLKLDDDDLILDVVFGNEVDGPDFHDNDKPIATKARDAKGNQFKIFGTVVQIIKQHLSKGKNQHYRGLLVSAVSAEPTRIRLYRNHLLPLISRELGAQFIELGVRSIYTEFLLLL